MINLLTNVDDLICEAKNLGPNQTGLKSGVIWISTNMSKHGCRIKYFPNRRVESQSLTITIPELKFTEDKLGSLIKDKLRKQILMFTKMNINKLEYYWKDGQYLSHDEETEFVNSLYKLTPELKKESRKLEIEYL